MSVVVAGGPRPAEVVKHSPFHPDTSIPAISSPMGILVDRFTCRTLEELEAALDAIDAVLSEDLLENLHFTGRFTATPNP